MEQCEYIELFAGIGGFHIGLDKVDSDFYKCVLANQWEPYKKDQFAAKIYNSTYPNCKLRVDTLSTLNGSELNADMIVGSFGCQNYSHTEGHIGKSFKYWWDVIRIINEMKEKPKFLLFENEEKLLSSPIRQRGATFALLLQSLIDLNYNIEWRVIDTAEYGMPQSRKKVYFFAFQQDIFNINSPSSWLYTEGIFAKSFPVYPNNGISLWQDGFLLKDKNETLEDISNNFNKANLYLNPFENGGVVINGVVFTDTLKPRYNGKYLNLRDILVSDGDRNNITEDYYISDGSMKVWKSIKENRAIYNTKYNIDFPDDIDKPARPVIKSDTSSSPNRYTHIIKDPVNGRLRRLIPIELERLQMFPDNYTIGETNKRRGFLLWNSINCGVVERIGKELKLKL